MMTTLIVGKKSEAPRPIRFPQYRAYEKVRAEANDAASTMLVSMRLASEHIRPLAGRSEMLPEILPDVADLTLMRVSPATLMRKIDDADRHFAYMAMPYALSVYESFVKDVLRMVASDDGLGGEQLEDITAIKLSELHSETSSRLGLRLDPTMLEAFEIARRLRNRVVHFGATSGGNLARDLRNDYSKEAQAQWTMWARKPLEVGTGQKPLPLTSRDAIAVLAVCKRLSEELSSLLGPSLPPARWADIVVSDLRSQRPRSWQDRRNRLEKVTARAKEHYDQLHLESTDLAAAVAREEARQSATP
jgi:hypothetical protein